MKNLEAYLTIEYTGKNGRRYKRTRKANSLVRGFIDILHAQMCQYGTSSGETDTSGAANTTTAHQSNFACNAAINVVNNGIRVGTGTNAVALGNYALQTPIANGTSAGQLSHAAVTFVAPTTVDTTHQFSIVRVFTNNTASPITVNEVALYCYSYNAKYICVDRTLSTFEITNGTSATVTYTLKVTVET